VLVPKGRGRPVVFLLVASPLIAEVLWGTTTVSQIAGLLAQIGLYGCGAILIRETAVRWHGGWPSVILLGAAYGAIEEGLLEPTWFTPRLFLHPYGVAGGVYWTYAVFNIRYHAVFSMGIPILLTEVLFPAWRGRPWLGRAGLAVTGAVYVLNAAAIGVLWYTVLQESAFGVPARLHPPQQAAAAAAVITLIVLARRIAGARSHPSHDRLPTAPSLALLASCAAAAWFAVLLLASRQAVIGWLPFPVPLALIAVALAAAGRCAWHLPRPGDLQLTAACTGALAVQAGAGFLFTGLHGPVDIIGKAIFNLAALGALTLLWRHTSEPAREAPAKYEQLARAPSARSQQLGLSPRASRQAPAHDEIEKNTPGQAAGNA
jgi:hypothetical protein